MKKLAFVLALTVAFAGCTTDPYTGEQKLSNTVGGAGIGAGVGALGGYLVGRAAGVDSGRAALIGAGIGTLGGGAVGAYMDNQEAKLRDQLRGTGVSVTRVGDRIILNMPSNITFPTDQSSILPAFYPTLNSVALVLKEYDKSIVNVYGHTDSQGSDGYNFTLSQQRASSVSQLLASQGVDPRRLNTQGFGESQPVASNDTESGRAQNRRVEIAISPLTAG
ncbi:MAG: OmpA family protein [Aurantimonas coralicida]|jgi:outer membrane protein OmpA-like peptidoglycan-associated protein|uniref:Outer membrane protein n=3 Tax=Aurantimonadaceae TaxID=255475 RepID=Q1YF04_AURMS|nr:MULTISPECIES: OmpA family protein [Aurantimonas]MCW7544629.1 OmpA family protein [Aurantimonas litoralis]EAS48741.1 outer membrane protein [Aurantimonas manganoxydans SI85-9A1]MBC6715427.1 OmpA family protein [Aurantimonas sp. DM33-3]MCC4296838.1 OmpA family protein [Aurantimonas coralicida]MCD1644397.1 OmpA family protein [Aurantimonas coralicida]